MFYFFKQKTAYEMRISDWSSDVCSSDLPIFACALLFDDLRDLRSVGLWPALGVAYNVLVAFAWSHWAWIKIATSVSVTVFSLSMLEIGRASCRDRVCKYV